jgi:hypothetical protein
MRKLVVLFSFLFVASLLVGQQTPQLAVYPDLVKSQTAASIDLTSYKSVIEGNVATTFQLEQNNAAAIAALAARVTALEQAPTAYDLTTLTVGALTGVDKNGINWNSGQWNATAQGVQPAVQTTGRNFVVPGTAVLPSITIECLTTACQVKFIDAAGEIATSPVLTPGASTVLPTGWTKPAGAVTVSMVAQAATDLRIRAVTF